MAYGDTIDQRGAVKPSNLEQEVFDTKIGAYKYVEIPSNLQLRRSYNDNSTVQYIGYAVKGLAEGTDGWLLQYLEYDDNRRLIKRTIAYGNWTNKTEESYS